MKKERSKKPVRTAPAATASARTARPAAAAQKSESGLSTEEEWALSAERLTRLAVDFQSQFWDFVVHSVADADIQKQTAEWLGGLQCRDGRARISQPVIQEVAELLRCEEEIEITGEALQGMFQNMRLRWVDYQDWIEQIERSPSGRAPHLQALKAVFLSTGHQIAKELLPLIRKQAARFSQVARSMRLEFEELVSLGTLGVFKSLLGWDSERGTVAAYARMHIVNEICEALRLQPTVIPSEKLGEFLREIERATTELRSRLGREPSPEDLAVFLDVPLKRIQDAFSRRPRVDSLDEPLKSADEPEGSTYMDILADPKSTESHLTGADQQAALAQLRKEIEAVLLKSKGLLGFRLDSFLLQDADGKPVPFAQAIEILRVLGYDSLCKKLAQENG